MFYSKLNFLLFYFIQLSFSNRLFILEYIRPCQNNLELQIRFEFKKSRNERNISVVSGVMNITEKIFGPNFAVKHA